MTDHEVAAEPGSDGVLADAIDDAAPRTVARHARRRRWVVSAFVAVGVAGAVTLAVVQFGRADDARKELGLYDGARGAATAFGAAYLTYDAGDVATSSHRVLSLTTRRFGQEFRTSRSPGIEALFNKIGTSTKATTTDVFITKISRGRAQALVVVDVHASSADTPDQTLVNLTFVLDLVLEGNRWKVDAVAPAPRPDVVGTTTTVASSPGTSTAPMAPAPAPTAPAPAP